MADHGELAARIARHTAGQITWPSLTLNQTCDACRHFDTGEARLAKGTCGLVMDHHRTKGKAFAGNIATACPQFESGTHWKQKK